MLLYPISFPTLKNMDYKQESLFNYKIFSDLGLFYRFSWPMAAILVFSSIFRGQILIECHTLYDQ